MSSPTRHVTRCLVGGVVALLPIGGTIFGVTYLEATITAGWRDEVSWYFPGLGLVLVVLVVYVVGLFVTTFLGRWLWRAADKLLERLPLVGTLYQSLKEVLGYDTEKDRFFEAVVAVRVDEGFEIGLVTGKADGPDGTEHTLVFVPSAPNPSNGRLLLLPPDRIHTLDLRAADALRGLVSMGKTPLRSGSA
ncbi:MAG: DUF502 domain-containing protein [Planctomycetota bacterium]|nr:DUF502 domain-containing protein [Planctomycetota bacterium]MEC9046863.1 DUF502 domain-containing protein [Planctomycetota bacterium]